MTFEDKIKEYAKSIPDKLEYIDTEETTKIALITPFLREMGYDTSNPSVVRAEYTADVGTKQGEKVDFAILEDGKPVIFIECKSVQNNLNEAHISQLYRYFSITDVQIGILTNGVDYRFQKLFYRYVKGYKQYVEAYYIANFWIPKKKLALDIQPAPRKYKIKSEGLRTFTNRDISPVAQVLKITEEDFKYPNFEQELLALLK